MNETFVDLLMLQIVYGHGPQSAVPIKRTNLIRQFLRAATAVTLISRHNVAPNKNVNRYLVHRKGIDICEKVS